LVPLGLHRRVPLPFSLARANLAEAAGHNCRMEWPDAKQPHKSTLQQFGENE
jgi:hypothetical protein